VLSWVHGFTVGLRLFSAATGRLLAQQRIPQVTVGTGLFTDHSRWDTAIALEPGLAVMSSFVGHDWLGAVSLPQLTGAS
jgi:hypothetical protein